MPLQSSAHCGAVADVCWGLRQWLATGAINWRTTTADKLRLNLLICIALAAVFAFGAIAPGASSAAQLACAMPWHCTARRWECAKNEPREAAAAPARVRGLRGVLGSLPRVQGAMWPKIRLCDACAGCEELQHRNNRSGGAQTSHNLSLVRLCRIACDRVLALWQWQCLRPRETSDKTAPAIYEQVHSAFIRAVRAAWLVPALAVVMPREPPSDALRAIQ